MISVSVLMFVLLTTSGPELSGRIVDDQGNGVEGAIVAISTARPRIGPATTCPSCYLDCAKRTLTDQQGRFTISGVSPKLLFTLAAGGAGYQGLVSEYYDPAKQPAIELKLDSIQESPEVKTVTGRVVDSSGNPIAGAEVRSRTIYRTTGRIGGSDDAVTPLTLTDSDGNFQITNGNHIRAIDLRVVAAEYAPNEATWQRGGDQGLQIALNHGASIRGRLMAADAPLVGVEVGLVQRNRTIGNIVTPREVSTDADGCFQFDQLPPEMDYTLYTHTGQGASGALPVSLVAAPRHGQRADLGDLSTQKPHRLKVIVRTEDGKALPPKSTVYVGRSDAWRGTSVILEQSSKVTVEINDMSDEVYTVSARVPGYQIIQVQPALNKDLNGRYPIRVNKDVEVVIMVRKNGAEKPKPIST